MNARRTAARAAMVTAVGGLSWIAIGVALLCVPHLWDWLDERRDRRVQRAYDEWGWKR